MDRIETDILIAGGGVAGLTAAAAFAAAGFATLCVDAEPPVTEADHARSDLRTTAFLAPSLFDRFGVDSTGYVGNPTVSMFVLSAGLSFK